jgi:hypothetical protein
MAKKSASKKAVAASSSRKPKKKSRYRSAVTGKLVKKEVADKNPSTTVKETVKKKA